MDIVFRRRRLLCRGVDRDTLAAIGELHRLILAPFEYTALILGRDRRLPDMGRVPDRWVIAGAADHYRIRPLRGLSRSRAGCLNSLLARTYLQQQRDARAPLQQSIGLEATSAVLRLRNVPGVQASNLRRRDTERRRDRIEEVDLKRADDMITPEDLGERTVSDAMLRLHLAMHLAARYLRNPASAYNSARAATV